MKQIVITLLTLSTLITQAQDYLVTIQQDTLRGRIRIDSNRSYDAVLLTDKDKKVEFSVTSVLAVFSEDQLFKPVRLLDGYRFLKLEKSGYLSLYFARQNPGQPYDIPYLVKFSGEALESPNIRFKVVVSNFLSDCATIKAKIQDENLGKKNLNQIIDAYNHCIEIQTNKSFAGSSTLTMLAVFQTKLEKDATIAPDILDILKDMSAKVRDKKPVPKYAQESLRNLLKDHPQYEEDLKAVLIALVN